MNNGWIKINRKILDWGWYQTPETTHLFLHLLLTANTEDKSWQGQVIKRGQLATGRVSLSKNTGISQQTIRTCLERLKSTSEITIESTSKFSIITVIKYNDYQSNAKDQPANQPAYQPATNQQLTTTKEYKNKKKRKNIAEAVAPLESSALVPIRDIPDLLKDKQKHIQIIGLYARAKDVPFTSTEHQSSFIRRNLRSAQNLASYGMPRIIEVMKYLRDNADFKWTLESVGKFIDDDLTAIKSKSDDNEDIIKKILNS